MTHIKTTGQCACGQVRLSIDGEVLRMMQCHCSDCRRTSGAGHNSNAFFKADDVRIEGEVAEYTSTADSGNENTRRFCPTCGSRLYNSVSARAGIIGIPVGILDDSSWFQPQGVVYAAERPAWDLTSTDIPNHDAMPG